MPATWPVQLEDKLDMQSFDYQFGEGTLRSDNETGPAKVRAVTTKIVDVINCSILLKNDEYTYFDTFYKTTLVMGSGTFNFIHPLTQLTMEVRFLGAPRIVPVGGEYFRLSMTWETV